MYIQYAVTDSCVQNSLLSGVPTAPVQSWLALLPVGLPVQVMDRTTWLTMGWTIRGLSDPPHPP